MGKKECLIIYGFIVIIVVALCCIIYYQDKEIEKIRKTNYEICIDGTCYFQLIGDYLDGKE